MHLSGPPDRHNRYPFERGYARNSAIIIVVSIATLVLLTYPQIDIPLYQNTVISTIAFASVIFGARFVRFRKIFQKLMAGGRVVIEKRIVKESNLVQAIILVGILLVVVLPVVSIRLMAPMIWLSLLLGYILGLNVGEFTYYLYIRNMESSAGQAIYIFHSEDPLTQKRIMGYRLEKTAN